MIHKNCGTDISFLGGVATVNRHKARSRANKLIYADNFTWFSGTTNVLPIARTFMAPLFTASFAIGTTGTNGWVDSGKISWNETCTGHIMEYGIAKMAKLFMYSE